MLMEHLHYSFTSQCRCMMTGTHVLTEDGSRRNVTFPTAVFLEPGDTISIDHNGTVTMIRPAGEHEPLPPM